MEVNIHRKGSFCIWLTGLPASGKSTLAFQIARMLRQTHGIDPRHLDGDILRDTVCDDLGFSPEDRNENITRVMGIASWMVHYGDNVPLCSFITPYEALRVKAKLVIPNCLMVDVRCPLEVCEARDPKGLYKKARSGEIPNFTGIGAPFEDVDCADIVVHTNTESAERISRQIIAKLKQKGWL